jgi:glutamate 5-kinase
MGNTRRMVVKVGSQVLCDSTGALDIPTLRQLVEQMAALRADGWDVLLVTSGAVAAGAGLVGERTRRISNPVTRKQVLAAAGQVQLMETWQQQFRGHDLPIAQILATRSDFTTRGHYLNMRACIEAALDTGILPVVNENDVVSVTELMFTDNDELAGLLAGMTAASHLCLLTSVDGVYAGDPSGGNTEVIAMWDEAMHGIDQLVQAGTSQFGRGGMHSKISVARKAAGLGTEVVIANGRQPGVLQAIAGGSGTGTRFEARGKATPAKRWLASMDGAALGAVVINDGAELALRDRSRLFSLLPVGVVAVEGDFQRGDVIQVRNGKGRVLGCGRAQYDHDEARELLGQRDQKPVIHYDYLYLVD